MASCYQIKEWWRVESGWSEWCESVTALHGSINYGGSSPALHSQHWTRGLLTLTSVGTCVGTWYWYRVHFTLYTLYTSLVPSPPKTTPHCPHAAPWPPQQRRYTDIPELSNHLQSLHTLHFTSAVGYAGTGPTVDCHCAGTSALWRMQQLGVTAVLQWQHFHHQAASVNKQSVVIIQQASSTPIVSPPLTSLPVQAISSIDGNCCIFRQHKHYIIYI